MASPPNGLRQGTPIAVVLLVDSSSSDIKAGDFLVLATAGYVAKGAAAGSPVAIALEDCDAPSSDGGASVLADISTETVWEYPPDTGSVTQALVGVTMDIGGAQSINIDASSQDCVRCVGVDTVANKLLIQRINTNAGVV